jgi:hypothetical protein
MSIFLVTILSCSQVFAIARRLQNISLLTKEQKNEIILELRKVVPTCPVIIRNND